MSENTYHHLPSRFRTSNTASPVTRCPDYTQISLLYLMIYNGIGVTTPAPVPWRATSGGQEAVPIVTIRRVGGLRMRLELRRYAEITVHFEKRRPAGLTCI